MLFRQKFICGDSPVGRGVAVVQGPVAGAPLLRTMSAHSFAEALQECFVEFLIYRLSCRDELMTNQPVNVEERNQHGLDIGFTCRAFFGREDDDDDDDDDDDVLHWEDIGFVSGSKP